MGKFTRSRAENDEPLSAGRVEYLEQARQRARNKRIRRTAVLLVLLTGIVLFATGLVGSSVAMAKDFIDMARIALLPGAGWPQQTGVSEVTQVEALTGSFVELGKEGCVVYSRSGKKLNSIQSGYARPALAAGKNRFVLYNRSGNELRVESRTQNLYTKQLENSIFLCAMAAAVTAGGGQMMTNLYLVNLASGDPVSLANQSGVPQWLGWTSASTILAVYDSRAVLYNAGGGERAAYEFAGNTLKDISVDAAGNVALLLGSGQLHQAVLLDKSLNVQFSGTVSSANSIVRAGSLFYLLSDSGVECYNTSGEQQWSQTLAAKPQALLADTKELLLFSGNTAQALEVPQK